MTADARRSLPEGTGRTRPAALGLTLALAAALAATLSLGGARPLPTMLLLFQALSAALGCASLLLALVRHAPLRLGVWSHWHDAAMLGAVGFSSHLALFALR